MPRIALRTRGDARPHVRGDPCDERARARLAEMDFLFCELDHIQKRASDRNGVGRTGAGGAPLMGLSGSAPCPSKS